MEAPASIAGRKNRRAAGKAVITTSSRVISRTTVLETGVSNGKMKGSPENQPAIRRNKLPSSLAGSTSRPAPSGNSQSAGISRYPNRSMGVIIGRTSIPATMPLRTRRESISASRLVR